MKVVFLDRDGTIIKDPEDERVETEEEIELFPDSIEALKYLAENDYSVIFITNQAGIGEGRITSQDFERIHDKVLERLAPSGVTVLKTYMCPHSPEDGCECRKPKPTLVLQALKEFNLNPTDVYMIGDRESDIMAGINAGTKAILVQTANVPVTSEQASYTAPNLLDAVQYVVAH